MSHSMNCNIIISGTNIKIVQAHAAYRVRELEKARFGKRRTALYRNRSPLMRQKGSSQISERLH